MYNESITVDTIPQLKDNYSFIIKNKNNAVLVDPAESIPIIKLIENNNLNLIAILLTHHHTDHTAGVENILKNKSVPVYSPNKNINHTTNVAVDGDLISFDFIDFHVIETPGHTLDHIVFYNQNNNILFSGDSLFRLGCGRVFEGTYKQMYDSLIKIFQLNNKTLVYCGHEYTLNNLNFLLSIFPNNEDLNKERKIIKEQLITNGKTIPFNLGLEKKLNPFLSTESEFFKTYKLSKNLSDIEMFSYLRDLKNNF